MKTYEKSEIISSVSDASIAKVNMSATAFKILSSTIYTDKISAVIREVSTNACDAHIEAGKPDEPITVKLPTVFDPELVISDNGTGIPHEKIHDILMTYFGSSRDKDNDRNGGFGLGSKSPMAYTDQFSFEVRHDGVVSSHLVYFNGDGELALSKIFEKETDECNGVTVKIPVLEKDVDEFSRKAMQIYGWFRVHPNVVSHPSSFSVKRYVPESLKDGEYIFSNAHNPSQISVLMGDVRYSVDYNQLFKGRGGSKELIHSIISDNRLIIKTPIGSLSPHVSREMLSYDEKTIETLEKILLKIEKGFVEKIQEKISKLKNVYGINRNHEKFAYVETKVINKYIHGEFNSFSLDTMFRGKKVDLQDFEQPYVRHLITEKESADNGIKILHTSGWGSSRVQQSLIDSDTKRRASPITDDVSVLYLDQKTFRPYNIPRFYRDNRGSMCFVTETMEGLNILKRVFDGYEFAVEKLTDRVANGCKPEKRRKKSSDGGPQHVVFEGSERTTMSMSEIYDLIEDNVYFIGDSLVSPKRANTVRMLCNVDDENKFIRLNEKNFDKVIAKGGKSVLKDYKLSDKIKSSITNGVIQKTINEAVSEELNKVVKRAELDYLDANRFFANFRGSDSDTFYDIFGKTDIKEKLVLKDIITRSEMPDLDVFTTFYKNIDVKRTGELAKTFAELKVFAEQCLDNVKHIQKLLAFTTIHDTIVHVKQIHKKGSNKKFIEELLKIKEN